MRNAPFVLAGLAGMLIACGQAVGVPDVHDVATDQFQSEVVDANLPDLGADVANTDLPNGSPCTTDAQCASHICVSGPDLVHGCALGCRTDDDCNGQGVAVFCAVDREAGGARLACAGLTGSPMGFEGDPCTANNQCVSDLCLAHVCHEGCTADDQCVAGSHCVMQTIDGGSLTLCGNAPVSGVTVEDFTLIDGAEPVDHGGPRAFAVPDDVVSLTFIAQDTGGTNLYASVPSLQAPDGTLWIDSATWNGITEQPVREFIGEYQINSAMAPSNDTLHVQSGEYQVVFTLFNDTAAGTHVSTRPTRGIVRVKRAPGGVLPASATLHVRVFLVGLSGLSSANAASNTALQNALHGLQSIYSQVGLSVIIDGYADITGTDATTYSVIDSQAELDQLLTHSSTTTGDVLDLFLVRSISASAGLEGAIGVAGDILGPPGIHGTIHSGVVVGWESTMMFGAAVTAETMAHECGHYLGLWHTQESQMGCTTMLAANCSPYQGVDPISDTPSGRASDPYLMNWFTADGSNTRLSAGEGIVMRSNPMVR